MDQFEVVCVDDESLMLSVYDDLFAGSGVRIVPFEDPYKALDYIGDNSNRIGLVISDYKMPGLNGVDLRRHFKGRMEQIPFAIVSGFVSFETLESDVQNQVIKCIGKPFRNEEVNDLVKLSFAMRRRNKEEEEWLVSSFVEEGSLKLIEIEELLLKMDSANSDQASSVRAIARVIHTLKGAAACIALSGIERFAHDIETSMTPFLEQKMFPRNYVSILLKTLEGFREMFAECLRFGSCKYDSEKWAHVLNSHGTEEQNIDVPAAISLPRKISVAIDDLDKFMEIGGNLVILRNYVLQKVELLSEKYPDDRELKDVIDHLWEMQKQNSSLQKRAGEIRKVSFSEIVRPLKKLVRDLAAQMNKDIKLEIVGEAIRIELSLAKVIGDILIHMLRNAIDHGIESAKERTEMDKNECALLKLVLTEVEGGLKISLSDDGRGIDAQKIRAKVIAKGLASEESLNGISDAKMREWIFHSGFSTAEKVSEVSGRGIGMDMVRNMVLAVDGEIQLHSMVGKGTEFVVELPLPKMSDVRQAVAFDLGRLKVAVICEDIQEVAETKYALREQRLTCIGGEYYLGVAGTQVGVHFLEVLSGLDPKRNISSEELPPLIVYVQMGGTSFSFFAQSMSNIEDLLIRSLPGEILGHSFYSSVAVSGRNGLLILFDSDSIRRLAGEEIFERSRTA